VHLQQGYMYVPLLGDPGFPAPCPPPDAPSPSCLAVALFCVEWNHSWRCCSSAACTNWRWT
jgi:hypothetical protein